MRLKKICDYLNLECDVDCDIKGVNTLQEAMPNEISFFENKKYEKFLKTTKAKAVLIKKEDANKLPKSVIALITDEPYVKLALLTKIFAKEIWEDGEFFKEESAYIHPSAVIAKGAKIGKNVKILPNSVIGTFVEIRDNSIIYPNVTIYRDTKIGKNVKIHSGSIIGSDGFGYARKDKNHIKIYHLGRVIIEDYVEIGSNTSIDRAVFGKTIIKKGAIIDNLVQVAHNCEIGRNCVIVSQAALAGSTKLGDFVTMGGQSGTVGHLEITSNTIIAARGGVTKSIKKPGIYSGFPIMPHKMWLKLNALLNKLLKNK